MRVRQWIKELQKFKSSEPLVLGYWTKSFLQDLVGDDEYRLTDDDVLYLAEQDYDWSSINEQIAGFIDEIVADNKSQEEEVDEEVEEELWDTEMENA